MCKRLTLNTTKQNISILKAKLFAMRRLQNGSIVNGGYECPIEEPKVVTHKLISQLIQFVISNVVYCIIFQAIKLKQRNASWDVNYITII